MNTEQQSLHNAQNGTQNGTQSDAQGTFADVVQTLQASTRSENNALMYATTGNPFLDFMFIVPSLRVKRLYNTASWQDTTQTLFQRAWSVSPAHALALLFWLRDPRKGAGERDTARLLFRWVHAEHHDVFINLVPYIPAYGRWDDLLEYDTDPYVVDYVAATLALDMRSSHPSLLAKWMPSETSGAKSRALHKRWQKALSHIPAFSTPRKYRKVLSQLREKLKVVERDMSLNRWGDIIYEHVPSKAMLLYRKAFQRHDPERFLEYVQSVLENKTKMSANVTLPHEVVWKVLNTPSESESEHAVLEAIWRSIPRDHLPKVLVVVDTSLSMYPSPAKIGPIHIALGLGLFFAESLPEPLTNSFITFSAKPTMQKVRGETLLQRVRSIAAQDFGLNTNLMAVAQLVASVCAAKKVPQSELPEMILIISDMQFDQAVSYPDVDIKNIFASYGYQAPLLAFWNVASSSVQVFPSTAKTSGVVLLSGFSPKLLSLVLRGSVTQPELLLDEIYRDYSFVFDLVKNRQESAQK